MTIYWAHFNRSCYSCTKTHPLNVCYLKKALIMFHLKADETSAAASHVFFATFVPLFGLISSIAPVRTILCCLRFLLDFRLIVGSTASSASAHKALFKEIKKSSNPCQQFFSIIPCKQINLSKYQKQKTEQLLKRNLWIH